MSRNSPRVCSRADPPPERARDATRAAIFGGARRFHLLISINGEKCRCHSPAQVVIKEGETSMGDKGSKDKGKKEKQKKAQHNLKEKRKLKREKRENK